MTSVPLTFNRWNQGEAGSVFTGRFVTPTLIICLNRRWQYRNSFKQHFTSHLQCLDCKWATAVIHYRGLYTTKCSKTWRRVGLSSSNVLVFASAEESWLPHSSELTSIHCVNSLDEVIHYTISLASLLSLIEQKGNEKQTKTWPNSNLLLPHTVL